VKDAISGEVHSDARYISATAADAREGKVAENLVENVATQLEVFVYRRSLKK